MASGTMILEDSRCPNSSVHRSTVLIHETEERRFSERRVLSLYSLRKHVKIRTPRTCECNRTLRMASNVPDLSATIIDKHVTYREPIVQKEY